MLRPLRVVIDNYPEGQAEEMEAVNNPEDAAAGTRKVPFSRVLYIEQDDFREDPPKQYFRLAPGREVRLRYAYFITCTGVVKDERGEVVEVHCTYDPATRGGNAPDGRKVKSTIHWVSAAHAIDAEVRLYETCSPWRIPNEVPEGQDFTANLNPNSLEVLTRREARTQPARRGGREAAISSSGWATSASIQDSTRGEAGVQPDRRAARHVGENRESEVSKSDDHSGTRVASLSDAACAVLKDGDLEAAVEETKLVRRWPRGRAASRSVHCGVPATGGGATAMRWNAWRWCGRSPRRRKVADAPDPARPVSPEREIAVVEHHLAHAASAFFASPFESATVLTLDREAISAAARAGARRTPSFRLENEWYYPGFAGPVVRRA